MTDNNLFYESNNEYNFDNYLIKANNPNMNLNKDQLKDLNYKYISTTEEMNEDENSIYDLKNPSNKNRKDPIYMNNIFPRIIEPNINLRNNQNHLLNSTASGNCEPVPAYSCNVNYSYNSNGSMQKDKYNNNINNYNYPKINNLMSSDLYSFPNVHMSENNPLNLSNSSNHLNSNLDKLLGNLRNQSIELNGKNNENMKLKDENLNFYNTINDLEAKCINLSEENEYKIFYLTVNKKIRLLKVLILEDCVKKLRNISNQIKNGKKQLHKLIYL